MSKLFMSKTEHLMIPWTTHFRVKIHASIDHVEDVNFAHNEISVAKNCCDFKAYSTLDYPLYKIFVRSAQYRSVQLVLSIKQDASHLGEFVDRFHVCLRSNLS